MIRTAIYCRVSTDQQAREGDSIAAQLDALTKYVNDRADMMLAGEYIDEGISGRKADRDELQRLLDDVKSKKVDQIVFTKLDRWFRSVRHYTATQEYLDKYGVTWLAIWEPIYDTTTAAGRLIVNQMMSIAQFEAENTSQRIKAVMAYKVEQGEAVTGKTPIGYSIIDKRLVPNEDADFARAIFDKYVETGSLGEVVRWTAAHGRMIQKQNLKYMLKNRKYIGIHRKNEHYCEPIVSRDVFETVQRQLKMNVSIAAKYTYLFTGLVKCSECGHRMGTGRKTGRDHHFAYYRCHCYYVPPRRCTNKKVIYEHTIEQYLLDEAQRIAGEIKIEASAKKNEHVDHTKQLAAIDRKLERLKELFLADQLTLDEYKADRAKLEEQKGALAVKDPDPDQAGKGIDALLAIKDLKTLYSTFSDLEKRALWRGIIRYIEVHPDGHFDVHFI